MDSEPLQTDNTNISLTKKSEKSRRDCLFLYFAAFSASWCFFSGGISMVWTSPVIPKLRSNDPDINPLGHIITNYEASLLVGLYSSGKIFALLIGGKLVDGIGRKHTLLLMNTLNGVFLIVLSFVSDIKWMFAARIMNGICVGSFMTALPIFMSEIANDHNRGKFGCFIGVLVPVGQLYCNISGYFFSFKLFSIVCAIPVLVSVLPFLFVPESPVHLLLKNKREAALRALEKYRSNLTQAEIEKDIELMQCTIEHTREKHDDRWKSLFCSQPNRRGFIIGLGMSLTQNGCGIMTLMSFMGPVFEEAQVGISGNMVAILVGVLKISIFFFVANVVARLGRKTLMLTSAISCSILLFIIGTYFFMKDNNIFSYQNYTWLPVSSILLFICAYSFGLGPVTLATLGELFSSNIRATAVSTINCIGIMFGALLSSSFPVLCTCIGISGCMWFFSVNCFIGAVFLWYMMPETEGKSFFQIHEMLKEKKNF